MRIGIVCYPTFGGSGVMATELGMALAQRDCEIHFITYNQPVRLELLSEHIYFHEVLLESYPLFEYQPYELALSSKMVEVVEKYQLAILHVHYAIPHAYAAFMAKQILKQKGIDIKVVTTLHGTDITLVGSHPSYKTAVEFSINNSDSVTAVSQSLKRDTQRLFNIINPIEVIYNFVDTKKYDQVALTCKRDTLAKSEEYIITHISNFRSVKRTLDVISIFHKVQQQIAVKLLMIGEGPERLATENLSKKLQIDDKVLFLGNTSEVAKILCYSDVFMLPSTTESFGLAALEAMAAGTPVISTNTGGLPEVNIQGKTGFLSNLGDIEQMAQNTIVILKDKKTLATFKRNAKQHSKRFSLENIIPIYQDLYRQTLRKDTTKR